MECVRQNKPEFVASETGSSSVGRSHHICNTEATPVTRDQPPLEISLTVDSDSNSTPIVQSTH
eukprot:1061519-Pelagomonas_calceolata.AAC.4